MQRIRSLITSAAVAALVVAALGGPAATASNGRVTMVNGLPGTKVDVCLGKNNEIRSRLPYGGVFRAQLGGTKKLVFRVAARGTCKGKLVASRTVTFAAGSDTTIVATSEAPRVLVFDNSELGTLAAVPDSALAMRHAADLTANDVYFRLTFWEAYIKDNPLEPAAEVPFSKGSEYVGPLFSDAAQDLILRATATRADPTIVIARTPLIEVEGLKRYEFILVGTKAANAKLLAVVSTLSAPPA